jgi:hypothetical protein
MMRTGLRGGGISRFDPDYFRRLPADRFPVIASMADTIVADSDQRFEFGVERLLDGLTARLQAGR